MEAGQVTERVPHAIGERLMERLRRQPWLGAVGVIVVIFLALVAGEGLHDVAQTGLNGLSLGAIYALAVSSGTVLQAGALLLVYSLGLAVPFLAMGLAYNGVKPIYTRTKRYIWIVNYLSGAMLIIVGILIYTDSLINLNSLFNFEFLRDISGSR